MTTLHIHAGSLAGHRSLLDVAGDCLSAEELGRAARFRVDAARDEFLVSRLLLRRILAAHLDRPAAAVGLARNPYGKPLLHPAEQSDLEFNLSHSHGRLLVAVCRGFPVGIDIERIDPAIDPLELAEHGLPAEGRRRLRAAAPEGRHDLFFRLWTRREACLKAFGTGFLGPRARGADAPERHLWVRELPVGADFKAAVALASAAGPPPSPAIEWHDLPIV
jgi:4'-phosphopantetheinyl transferase